MLAKQADGSGTSTGTPSALEQQIIAAVPQVEQWLRDQWQTVAAPFYASVDLRNGGYKIAPIDVNLFPGGFNNLDPETNARCLGAIMDTINRTCPNARGVLLVPENHTRNTGYTENVVALQNLLRRAGVQLRVGSVDPNLTSAADIESANGTLRLEPVKRSGNRIGVSGFDPCLVLLNNDLSGGVPEILRNLDQPVLPPLYAGWTTRRKSNHFALYEKLASQVATLIGIDPWFISAKFARCGSINFRERSGEECLEGFVAEVLQGIRSRYKEYGITQDPFVIVKSDAGTYGMAVMTIKDPSEIRTLNRKQRKKMEMGKGHAEVHEVMVQEGVYTADLIEDSSAEPVIYMVDKFVIGGYYRVAAGRTRDENLNVPGSHFVTVAFDSPCHFPDPGEPPAALGRFHAYGILARVALVATAIELAQAREIFETTRSAGSPGTNIGNNTAAQ